jgi:hypothetical protein
MTSVVISQPMLFPWPGFFELTAQADLYIHLDDAQFSRGGFTNRVQVKLPTGRVWMTIPLTGKGSFQRIADLSATGTDWKTSHRDLIRQSLTGAPYAKDALTLFDACYGQDRICDLLTESIEKSAAYLGFARPKVYKRASTMGIEGKSWQRVLDMVLAVDGTSYITAHGARNYLDHEAFEKAGVAVRYCEYSLTPYPQLHGEFVPYVTILDLIAAEGPNAGARLSPRSVDWRTFLARQAQTEEPG